MVSARDKSAARAMVFVLVFMYGFLAWFSLTDSRMLSVATACTIAPVGGLMQQGMYLIRSMIIVFALVASLGVIFPAPSIRIIFSINASFSLIDAFSV